MKSKAIGFSRHDITDGQSAEIAAAGYEVITDGNLKGFAVKNMTSDEEVMDVICRIQLIHDNGGIRRFYGVFPPALRSALITWREKLGGAPIELWESWNIQRSPDGGKPTFEHKKFVLTFKG